VSLKPGILAQAKASFRSSDRLSLKRGGEQWRSLITRILA